jgi:hypothetical protein
MAPQQQKLRASRSEPSQRPPPAPEPAPDAPHGATAGGRIAARALASLPVVVCDPIAASEVLQGQVQQAPGQGAVPQKPPNSGLVPAWPRQRGRGGAGRVAEDVDDPRRLAGTVAGGGVPAVRIPRRMAGRRRRLPVWDTDRGAYIRMRSGLEKGARRGRCACACVWFLSPQTRRLLGLWNKSTRVQEMQHLLEGRGHMEWGTSVDWELGRTCERWGGGRVGRKYIRVGI